eukprot:NODE_167_length_14562_cov_0.357256.p4 type:complete len:322 gc:universal NODE_167_length_14562_cov_0.357256:11514-12479(+)
MFAIYAFQFVFDKTILVTPRNTFFDSGDCIVENDLRVQCIRKSTRWHQKWEISYKQQVCHEPDYHCNYLAGIHEQENVNLLIGLNLQNIVEFYKVEQIQGSSDNFVSLYTSRAIIKSTHVSMVNIYMEKCERNIYELHLLRNNRVQMAFNNVKQMSRDILNAISALHHLGYYHLDIKPQNIVKCINGVYKLIDFEYLTSHKMVHAYHGTPPYSPKQVNDFLMKVKYDKVSKNSNLFDAAKWDIIGFAKSIYHMIYITFSPQELDNLCYSDKNQYLFPNIKIFPSLDVYNEFIELMMNIMNCNMRYVVSAKQMARLKWFRNV